MHRLIASTLALSTLAALSAGCFAEVTGSYYIADVSDAPVADTKTPGYSVGVNLGFFYDHKQGIRGSLYSATEAMPLEAGKGGKGKSYSSGVGLQGDYQFVHFGSGYSSNRTIAVTGAATVFGKTTTTLEPMGADKIEGTGTSYLNLFGGLTMTMPFAHSAHSAYWIAIGGTLMHAGSDAGDVSGLGATAKIRYAWSPIAWVKNNPDDPNAPK